MNSLMDISFIRHPWVLAPVSFVVALIVLTILAKWLLQLLHKVTPGFEQALKRPTQIFILLLSATFSVHIAVEEGAKVFQWFNPTVKALTILSAVWIIERTVSLFIQLNAYKIIPSTATRDLVVWIARIAIVSLGSLVALDNIGVSITPLLASLGVGSIAVALALQDTLGNFFSGIYILIDQPFRVGDIIRMENELEGTVEKIGWRSTHVLLGTHNIVVIPNSKLASLKVTNFNLPSPSTTVVVTAAVQFKSNLETVERVALETAKEITGQDCEFRFINFADYGIQFSVALKSASFAETGALRSEFIKAFTRKLRLEGIDFATGFMR